MENNKYVQTYKFIENNIFVLTDKFLENNTYVPTDKSIENNTQVQHKVDTKQHIFTHIDVYRKFNK